MAKPVESVEKMSFEEAYARLEEVVRSLESGELSLEDAIQNFERGQILARHCGGLLDRADLKIRELTGPEMDAAAA